MQESTLHSQLKNIYTTPGSQQEIWVDGFQVDVLQGDLIVEIQTKNFSAIKPKLEKLLPAHPILLVFPVYKEKLIIRQMNGQIRKRRSPRQGRIEDVFYELIRMPALIHHPNFRLDILLIKAAEYRVNDGKGSWRRRGWSIVNRELLQVYETIHFSTANDFLRFIPKNLPSPFTSKEYAAYTGLNSGLARKAIYCLTNMQLLTVVGKRGRMRIFELM